MQTRGPLVVRDIDVLKQLKAVRVNMSLPTDSERVRRLFEPKAPPLEKRWEAIHTLREAGIPVGICVTPTLPIEDIDGFAKRLADFRPDVLVCQDFHDRRRQVRRGHRRGRPPLAPEIAWAPGRLPGASSGDCARRLDGLRRGGRLFPPSEALMLLASPSLAAILQAATSALGSFIMRLLAIPVLLLLAAGNVDAQPKAPPPFPAVSDKDVWGQLPPRKTPPLPEWAKVLAGPLPKTTAKMLELDYFHREKNPLGPDLSARIRWTVAGRPRLQVRHGAPRRPTCAPAEGKPHAGTLANDRRLRRPRRDRFRPQADVEGHAITDAEFAERPQAFGPEKVDRDRPHRRLRQLPQPHRARARASTASAGRAAGRRDSSTSSDRRRCRPRRAPPWDDLKAVKAERPVRPRRVEQGRRRRTEPHPGEAEGARSCASRCRTSRGSTS